MLKILIKNLDRLKNRKVRLVKGQGATSDIKTQTGAVYENATEVGLCLAPLIEESDIRIFPQSTAEYDSLIAAFPAVATRVNPLLSNKNVLSANGKTITLSPDMTDADSNYNLAVGYSFDKKVVDDLFADNNFTKVIGTKQYYTGLAVVDPELTTTNFTVGDLQTLIQAGYTHNNRYYVLLDANVIKEAKLTVNKHTLNLANSKALYNATTIGADLKINYAKDLLEMSGYMYPITSDQFDEFLTLFPAAANMLVNFTTGNKVADATLSADKLTATINWKDFVPSDYNGNGNKNLTVGIILDKNSTLSIAGHLDTLGDVVIGKEYAINSNGEIQSVDILASEFRNIFSLQQVDDLNNGKLFKVLHSLKLEENKFSSYYAFNYADDVVKLDKTFRLNIDIQPKVKAPAVESDVRIFPISQTEYDQMIALTESIADSPYTYPNATVKTSTNTEFSFELTEQWYQDAPNFLSSWSFNKEQIDKLIASSLPDSHVVGTLKQYNGPKTNTPELSDPMDLTLGDVRGMRQDSFFEIDGRLVMYGATIVNLDGQVTKSATFNLDDGTEYLKDSLETKTTIVGSLMDPEFVFESFPLSQTAFNEIATRSNWFENLLNPYTTTGVTLSTVGGDNAQVKISGVDLKSVDVVGKNLINAITFKQSMVPYLQKQDRADNFISFNNGQVVYTVGQTLDKLQSGEFYINNRVVFVMDPTARVVAEDGFNTTINNVVYYKNLVGANDSKVVKQVYELEVKADVVATESSARVFPRGFAEYQSFVNSDIVAGSGITYLNPYINSDVTVDTTNDTTFAYTANNQWYQDANIVASGIAFNKEQLDRAIASTLPDDRIVYNGVIYTGDATQTPTFEDDFIFLGDLRAMRQELVDLGEYVIFDLGISLVNDSGIRKGTVNLDDGTGYLKDSVEIKVEATRNLLPANYYFSSFPLSAASFDAVANKTSFYANRFDPYNTNGINVSKVGGSEAELRTYGIDLNPETFTGKNIINAVVFSQTLVPYLRKLSRAKEFIKFNGTDLILTVGQVLDLVGNGGAYIDTAKRLVYIADTTARTIPETGLELQLANVINYVDANDVNQSVTLIQNFDLKVQTETVEPTVSDVRPVPYDQSEADAFIAMSPGVAEYAINPFTDPNVVISGQGTNELVFNINNWPEQTNKLMIIGHSFNKVQVDKLMTSSLPDSTPLGINASYAGAVTDQPTFTNTPLTKGDLKGALPYLPVINGRYYLTNQAQITDNSLMTAMNATFNFDDGTGYLTQAVSKVSLKANKAAVSPEISCEGATNEAGPLDMEGTYDVYVDDMNTPAYTSASVDDIVANYAGNQNKQLAVTTKKDPILLRSYSTTTAETTTYSAAYEAAHPGVDLIDPMELMGNSNYVSRISASYQPLVTSVYWPGVTGEMIGKVMSFGLSIDTTQLNKFLNLGLDFDTVVGTKAIADSAEALLNAPAVDYTYGEFLDEFTPTATNSFVEGTNTVFFTNTFVIGTDTSKAVKFTLHMASPTRYNPVTIQVIIDFYLAHTRLFPATEIEFNQFMTAVNEKKAQPGFNDLFTDYVNPFTLPNFNRVYSSSDANNNTRIATVDYDIDDPTMYGKNVPTLIAFRADLVDGMLAKTDDNAIIGNSSMNYETATNLTLGSFRIMMSVAVKVNGYYVSLIENWLINSRLNLDYTQNKLFNLRIKLDGYAFGATINTGCTINVRPVINATYTTDYRSFTESQSVFEQVAAIADTGNTWINPFTTGTFDSEDVTQPDQKHITLTTNLWSLPADKVGDTYQYGLLLNKSRIDWVVSSSQVMDSSTVIEITKSINQENPVVTTYSKERIVNEFLPTAKTITKDGIEYYIFVIENTVVEGAVGDSIRLMFGAYGTGNRLRAITTQFSFIQ